MMTEHNNALELVFSRNAFYRRLHFLAFAAFILSLFIIIALSFIIYFLAKHPTHPVYFATNDVGKIIKVTPITEPNMSDDEVAAWVVEGVQALLSYDYLNYQRQLQSAQKYFTNYGWTNAMQSLTLSNNLNGLSKFRWIVITQAVQQPKLITKGILGGAYAWKFEFPILINFWSPPYDDNSKLLNPWYIRVIVQRQPILQSYKGLGIIQLIAEQAYQAAPRPGMTTS